MPIQTTPTPAHPCDPTNAGADLPGAHHCPGSDGRPDLHPWFTRPGEATTRHSAEDPRVKLHISLGFNFGLVLLPYCRDWGEIHGIMTRRKAYPTIFHSFALATDRGYALASIPAFVSIKDTYFPRFVLYLLTVKPFAGYRWQAKPAQLWLTYAQAKADAQGAQGSLNAEDTVRAAIAWCGEVRGYWDILTNERFPYSAPDLLRYWRVVEPAAALPEPLPVSP